MSQVSTGELLDAFEDAFPDTGFVIDDTGTVVRTFAGPEIEVLIVETLEETIGQTVGEVFRPETAEAILHQITQTLETETLQTREYVIETEVGARSFEARTAPVHTRSKKQLIVATFRDITARDLYAHRLDENNRIVTSIQLSTQAVSRATNVTELYESICETITSSAPYLLAWVGRLDPENDAVHPLTNNVESDSSGAPLGLDLLDEGPETAQIFEMLQQGEAYIVQDIHAIPTDHEWRRWALSEGFHSIGVFPIGDPVERVLAVFAKRPFAFGFSERNLFLSLCRDVTFTEDALANQERIAEQNAELESMNAEWEILNRLIRHDIRNKMTVILGRAELLAEEAGLEGNANLESITGNSEQVVEITKEARKIAEAIANTGQLERIDVDLADLLDRVIQESREIYPEAEITVESDTPAVTVKAGDIVSSVFRNLISNAVVHNRSDDRTVTIRTSTTDETVVVEIADNGPGIPEKVASTVFEEGKSVGDGEGHGMGLFLVSELIDQYGGDISVADNDPVGSIVTVELSRG